jgi:hypothetical protein
MADRLALEFLENLIIRDAGGGVEFDADDLWVMLLSAVPSDANLDAWDFRDDVTNEITGTGYTAGGMDLGAFTGTKDTTNNRYKIDFPDSVWAGATFSAVAALVYKKTGGAASTDPIVGVWDFGGTKTATGGSFTIQWHADGLILVTGG